MKTLILFALSMIASQAHADVTPCLAAAQAKGQVVFQCSQPKTEKTVIISQATDSSLTLTFCKTLATDIESGAVEFASTKYFSTYTTPEGDKGDAVYELKTDNWGSHFAKRSEGDSLDLDFKCGKVGTL